MSEPKYILDGLCTKTIETRLVGYAGRRSARIDAQTGQLGKLPPEILERILINVVDTHQHKSNNLELTITLEPSSKKVICQQYPGSYLEQLLVCKAFSAAGHFVFWDRMEYVFTSPDAMFTFAKASRTARGRKTDRIPKNLRIAMVKKVTLEIYPSHLSQDEARAFITLADQAPKLETIYVTAKGRGARTTVIAAINNSFNRYLHLLKQLRSIQKAPHFTKKDNLAARLRTLESLTSEHSQPKPEKIVATDMAINR